MARASLATIAAVAHQLLPLLPLALAAHPALACPVLAFALGVLACALALAVLALALLDRACRTTE
eukprot:14545534-Alexandrium_andersonii.AAC.1